MLVEAKRLYALGLATHWLNKKSKAPVKSGWTKGPREEWPSLERAYKVGFNLGVRLGRASQVGDYYLTVIDCDVKSKSKKHLKEMIAKLEELIGQVDAPTVVSGRGNGSKHLYLKSKAPVKPKRLSQSSESVKVYMPSVKASKKDIATLTPEEIKEGYRLRAAWEISLMGEGQQVVLPPSIHPDSGKPYEWLTPFTIKGLPVLSLEGIENDSQVEESATTSVVTNFVEVDLLDGRLHDDLVAMITKGEDVEDRSVALFKAASTMHAEGFSDSEILSVLTDKDYYLGEAAYDHSKSKRRERAAQWLKKYTLKKVKADREVDNFFNEEITDSPQLTTSEAEKQFEKLTEGGDWTRKLERIKYDDDKSPPKTTLANVLLILRNALSEKLILFDTFAVQDSWGIDTPWSKRGAVVTDKDAIACKVWLKKHYRFEPSVNLINEAFIYIGTRNQFHPVRDWLDTLKWDGEKRVATWLRDYLNSEKQSAEYLEAVGTLMLAGMVGRIYNPGCKFDWVPILEGTQGVGKSSTPRILAGDKWFSDASIPLGDKDAVMNLQGVWVYELGELTAMSKYDTGLMKEFVARTTDKIRPPYGERLAQFPRQCVFVGTTDKEQYLKDDVGHRRYLPISVGQVEFSHLEKDREQLFAEVVEIYKAGYSLVEEGKRCELLAAPENLDRVEFDEIQNDIESLLSANESTLFNVNFFTVSDVISALPLGLKNDRTTQMRVANCLKKLNFVRVRFMENGSRKWRWQRKKA